MYYRTNDEKPDNLRTRAYITQGDNDDQIPLVYVYVLTMYLLHIWFREQLGLHWKRSVSKNAILLNAPALQGSGTHPYVRLVYSSGILPAARLWLR